MRASAPEGNRGVRKTFFSGLLNRDPRSLARASRDRLAQRQFIVSGLKIRELRWRAFAGLDVSIEIFEQLQKCVGIAFGMSAGIHGVGPSRRRHERRIFQELLVRLAAVPDPEV